MVLCIVDSDRTWPGGEIGETARFSQEAFREISATAVADLYVLPVRMIENLFSEALVTAAFAEELPHRREVLARLCEALRAHGPLGAAALAHHKLKSNLLLGNLFFERDQGYRAYLTAFRSQLTVDPPAESWCEDRCKAADPKRCRCLLVPGLDLLKPVARFCERQEPRTLAALLFSPVTWCSEHWEQIAAQVVAWGCAFKPPRV